MLESLKSIDQNLFHFLNGFHSPFFDTIIWWGTHSLTWLPLYFLLAWLVIRAYRWQTFWILMVAALMIMVSDQLTDFFKFWVARPRPTHEPGLTGIHTIYGYSGGLYGFYSAHASNNMAITIFIILIFRNSLRWLPPLIICYAVFISYTRIYLGVHYPGDILCGWIAGGLIGWGSGLVCNRLIHQKPVI